MSVGSVGPGRARGSILALLLVAAATFVRPSTALAEQGEELSEEAEPPPLPPRREVPDLDGRPPSDANDVADAFLWIPRCGVAPQPTRRSTSREEARTNGAILLLGTGVPGIRKPARGYAARVTSRDLTIRCPRGRLSPVATGVSPAVANRSAEPMPARRGAAGCR